MDIAVAYNPQTRTCDLVFNGRDFALDDTPVSAMLLSIGTDRRARPDDDPAAAVPFADPSAPASLVTRRGWAGDALDPQGRQVGSRLWLAEGRKQDETTRKLAEQSVAEGLAWLTTDRGLPVTVVVRWMTQAKGMLGFLARAGATPLRFQVAAGAALGAGNVLIDSLGDMLIDSTGAGVSA